MGLNIGRQLGQGVHIAREGREGIDLILDSADRTHAHFALLQGSQRYLLDSPYTQEHQVGDVLVKVNPLHWNQVRLRFEGPRSYRISRHELFTSSIKENSGLCIDQKFGQQIYLHSENEVLSIKWARPNGNVQAAINNQGLHYTPRLRDQAIYLGPQMCAVVCSIGTKSAKIKYIAPEKIQITKLREDVPNIEKLQNPISSYSSLQAW